MEKHEEVKGEKPQVEIHDDLFSPPEPEDAFDRLEERFLEGDVSAVRREDKKYESDDVVCGVIHGASEELSVVLNVLLTQTQK